MCRAYALGQRRDLTEKQDVGEMPAHQTRSELSARLSKIVFTREMLLLCTREHAHDIAAHLDG